MSSLPRGHHLGRTVVALVVGFAAITGIYLVVEFNVLPELWHWGQTAWLAARRLGPFE